MARNSDHLAEGFETDNTDGVLGGLLAEEDELDHRALWRIGSWGVGATAAVILAVMANQSSLGLKRDQVAAADLSRQAQQIQLVARETQSEARRLASAIDTLNGDRDRLYSRVTSLEQGLDSVTGTIARQTSVPAPPPAAAPHAAQGPPAPAVAPVATTEAATPVSDKPAPGTAQPGPATVSSVAKDAPKTGASKTDAPMTETVRADTAKTDTARPEVAKASPAIPLMATQSIMAPPDPAAGKLIEPSKTASPVVASPIPEVVASAPSANEAEDETTAPKVALQRTEFGVDLGGANSVGGLRALWRGMLKSKSNAPLTALRPVIVVKEGTNGLGMQLRLVAGPLNDAGAAARICAVLTENKRRCETAIFDGQRLSLKADDAPPAATKPAPRRRGTAKQSTVVEEPAKKPEPARTLSSFFGRKNSE